MGYNVDNAWPGPHGQPDAFLGYGTILHRGNQGQQSRTVDTTWSQFRLVIIAARSGTDAELDAAAAAAWGDWWATTIIPLGRRAAQRIALANYIPLEFPIP